MDFGKLMNFIQCSHFQVQASQQSKAPTPCVALVQEYNSMYKDSPFKIDAIKEEGAGTFDARTDG